MVFGIPILQGCFQVAFEEINRGQKLARVRVMRVQAEGLLEALLCGSKILLLVCQAGKLNQEPRIPGSFLESCLEGQFRFAPFFQAREG